MYTHIEHMGSVDATNNVVVRRRRPRPRRGPSGITRTTNSKSVSKGVETNSKSVSKGVDTPTRSRRQLSFFYFRTAPNNASWRRL
jgi:hypothetical protein